MDHDHAKRGRRAGSRVFGHTSAPGLPGAADPHRPRSPTLPRFIPCRTTHLAGELAERWPPEARPAFWHLVRVVEDLHHHRGSTLARLVESLYAPFDPDADTLPPERPVHPRPVARLVEQLGALLERANYDRIPTERLLTATDREVLARLKLETDANAIEEIGVWVRGRGHKAILRRPFRSAFRLVEREVETYRRVVLVVRTAHDPCVVLKLFKDVPRDDLELLLPTVRVRMKLLDKLKLSGSGGAAAVSAWKLLKVVWLHAPGLAKLLAIPLQALLLPFFVVVTGVYGGKTLVDYTKIRVSYVAALAEHLYAITMASNGSVVARLAAMAGEEDTKEALLAYALLSGTSRTRDELKAAAEELVWDRYRARIGFDVDDALAKLRELALVAEDEAGRLSALPLPAASRSLDAAWDEVHAPPGRREAPPPVRA